MWFERKEGGTPIALERPGQYLTTPWTANNTQFFFCFEGIHYFLIFYCNTFKKVVYYNNLRGMVNRVLFVFVLKTIYYNWCH